MTENEERLLEKLDELANDPEVDMYSVATLNSYFEECGNTIRVLLEKIQQYRAIGTIEECRTAVERMKPKKPIEKLGDCYSIAKDGTKDYEIIQECPNCHSIALRYSYPCRCGQVLDWSE